MGEQVETFGQKVTYLFNEEIMVKILKEKGVYLVFHSQSINTNIRST